MIKMRTFIIFILFAFSFQIHAQTFTPVDDGDIQLGTIKDIEFLGNGIAVILSNKRIYQVSFDEDYNYSVSRIYNPYDEFTRLFKIDRDRDGIFDICAYAPGNERGVSFFSNDGSKLTYVERWLSNASSMYLDDFDEDGANELLLNGGIYSYNSDGSIERLIRNANINSYVYEPLLFFDLDKDGDKDIVYRLSNNFGWFEVSEKDFVLPRLISSLNSDVNWITRVTIDGEIKLIEFSRATNDVNIITYDTTNVVINKESISDEIDNTGRKITTHDLNNDGHSDLQIINTINGQLTTLIYDSANGRYVVTDNFSAGVGRSMFFNLENGDKKVFVMSQEELRVYEYDEDYKLSEITEQGDGKMKLFDYSFVDINGDGYTDQVNFENQKRIYNGDIDFDGQSIFNTPTSSGVFRDYDEDGFPDLIVDSLWYRNVNGIFSESMTYPDYITYPEPEIFFVKIIHESDIDQDGDIDLLLYNNFGESLFVMENLNDESFSPQVELANSEIISGDLLYVNDIDLDGDGDNDILMAAATGLIWLENSGGLIFEDAAVLYDTDLRPRSIAVEDGNSDGLPDIVLGTGRIMAGTARGDYSLFIGTNNGPVNKYTSAQFDGYQYVDFINADQVGDKDVLRHDGSKVYAMKWSEYNASAGPQITIAEHSDDVLVQDVDSDGDDDVILYENGSSYFRYVLNGYTNTRCPDHVVTLRNQADINEYAIDYGGCKVLDNDLFIGSNLSDWSDVDNVSGLGNLEKVTGDMTIRYVNGVQELDFSSLKEIDGTLKLEIIKVQGTPTFKSLEKTGGLLVNNLQFLFTQQTDDFFGSLTDINGDIELRFHDISDISPFVPQDTVHGNFIIENSFFGDASNPMDIRSLERLKVVEGEFTISFNVPMIFERETLSNLHYAKSFTFFSETLADFDLSLENDTIDNFRIEGKFEFPGNSIKHINNNLYLSRSDISNFDQLEYVGETFRVSDSKILDGSFANVKEIGKNLDYRNTNDTDLTRFSNSNKIGSIRLSSELNDFSLEGIEHIDSLESLYITNTPSLTDLTGLNENLVVETFIGFLGNENLRFCDYPFICAHLEANKSISIINNDIGCSAPQDLRCLAYSASGTVFYDYNKDGIFDVDTDATLSNVRIDFNGSDNSIITVGSGFYQKFLSQGDYFYANVNLPEDFTASTPTEIAIDSFYDGVLTPEQFNFGMYTTLTEPKMELNVNYGLFVCNRPFDLSTLVKNVGSDLSNGYIEITYPEGITLDPMFSEYLSRCFSGK